MESNRNVRFRRILSIAVAAAMMVPVCAPAVQAAVATWLAPPPGQPITTRNVEIAIGFNTQSDLKVTRLELWIDGRLYSRKQLVQPVGRGVASFWWDVTKYADGPHDLMAKIFAGDQLISTVTSTGTVGQSRYDLLPPRVTFANIKTGDILKGTARIKLNASDDSGEPPLVSLLVDNALKLVKNTAPYNYDLETTSYSDGDHQLETYAYDGSGNKSDPAVVKVMFKNGVQRPVVATMSIEPKSAPKPWDDGDLVESLPPVVAAPTAPALRAGVARAEDSAMTSREPTAPLATPEKPAKMEPKPAKPIVVAMAPPRTAVSTGPSVVRAEKPRSAEMGATRPAEPVAGDARVSSVGNVMAVQSPKTKADQFKARALPGRASEPTPSPRTSEAKLMAMAPPSLLRSDIRTGAAGVEPSAPVVDPLSAKAREVAVPSPVRVAIAPDIRGLRHDPAAHPAVACPPAVKKDTKAKIEKRTALASGKVKARDLFQGLGGILFWDSTERMVIAYVQNMKIELKIGSNIAMVNGKEMKIAIAPQIVDGRTIVDASVYHQARAMIDKDHAVALSTR